MMMPVRKGWRVRYPNLVVSILILVHRLGRLRKNNVNLNEDSTCTISTAAKPRIKIDS